MASIFSGKDDGQPSESLPIPQPDDRWITFYKRCSRWICLAYLLLSPAYLLISAKVLTPGDMSAYLLDVGHWLPQNKAMIADMEKFSKVAGKERGNVIRISWPDCKEPDHRIDLFTAALKELHWPAEFSQDDLRGPLFEDILTLNDLYTKLQESGPGLSKEQIHDQLKNVMIGDSGTTCVIATLMTSLPGPRAHAIDEIYSVANEVDGLSANEIRLFGGPVYTRQIDKSGARIATTFTPLSVLISLICAWFCLRRFRVLAALFLNALLGTCMALVSIYFSNVQMDPVLMLVPGFWMIMMLSGGIHFINYYFEVRNQDGLADDQVAGTAARMAFRPAFLATLTTCIGLFSLCTSDVMPVYRFGLHAAIGLACAFTSQFLFLPSFLQCFALGKVETTATQNSFWLRYQEFAVKFQFKAALVFLLLLAMGAYGFTHLRFSNRLKDQFKRGTRINTDTEWIEEEIGPLIPFEVLVRFPKTDLPRPSKCLGLIDKIQKRIESLPHPTKVISATAVVPYDAGSGARQTMRRAILDKRLQNHRSTLVQTGYVTEESEYELWRISVFTYSAGQNTMSHYFTGIRHAVNSTVNNSADKLKPAVSYAGLGARMAVITQQLGGGLLKSSLTSAILISIVVILALRSLVLGLTAMLPNIFPVVFSFGMFGFFNPSLDIGAIMTASIAMGIAVDDTIHFMYWFKQGLNSNFSREQAIQLAINKCGRAIAATSMICGLGFCVYFLCDFMPIARFGQLLFMMLAAALVGDLFFLPALLRTLPERLFVRKIPITSDVVSENSYQASPNQ